MEQNISVVIFMLFLSNPKLFVVPRERTERVFSPRESYLKGVFDGLI